MPRFYLRYEDRPTPAPPRRWTVGRVFVWTLMLASLGLWASALITR